MESKTKQLKLEKNRNNTCCKWKKADSQRYYQITAQQGKEKGGDPDAGEIQEPGMSNIPKPWSEEYEENLHGLSVQVLCPFSALGSLLAETPAFC